MSSPAGRREQDADSVGSWLDLVLSQSSTTEFEALRSRLRVRVQAEDVHLVDQHYAVALRLHEEMAQLRRRETELAALYRTATDLTQVRDLEEVLEAIVHRGQELLRSDVAYLSVVAEDGHDLYVRAAAGPVSPTFVGTRVDLGVGVGGRVADTRKPYQTANYTREEHMRHSPVLDRVVGGEGMVTLLGVPLEIGGRLLGVLFAANRYERPFVAQEIALLSSLAAHAAVALENARLFSDTRAAFDELRAAYDVIQEQSAAMEGAADVHVAFTEIVLRGQGVGEVVAAMTEVLGGGAAVLDAEGSSTLATVGSWSAEPLPVDVLQSFAAAREGGRARAVKVGGLEWQVAPVRAGADVLGALVMRRAKPLSAVEVRIFERAAQSIAVLLLAERAVREAERRNMGELLRELVDMPAGQPAVLTPDARRRLRLHGLGGSPNVVLVVEAALGPSRVTAALDGLTTRGHVGLAAAHGEHSVVVLPSNDSDAARDKVSRVLSEHGMAGATIISAGPVEDLKDVAAAYRAAERAARLVAALGRSGAVCGAEGLAMYSSLLAGTGSEGVEAFLEAHIGLLTEYDTRHKTALTVTLLAYLDGERSPRHAARILHVHVNTVVQRMARVDRLLGADWRMPNRALEIHVALRLLDLRRQLAAPAESVTSPASSGM